MKCPACGYENKQAVICGLCQAPLNKAAPAPAKAARAAAAPPPAPKTPPPEPAALPKPEPAAEAAPAPAEAPAAPAVATSCKKCGRKISAGLAQCQFCGAAKGEAPAATGEEADAEEADPLIALERIKKKVDVADQIHEQREQAQHPLAAGFDAVSFVTGAPVTLVALAIGGQASKRGKTTAHAIGSIVGAGIVLGVAALLSPRLEMGLLPFVAASVVAVSGLAHVARRWLSGAEAILAPPPAAAGALVAIGLVLLAASSQAIGGGAREDDAPRTREIDTLAAAQLVAAPPTARFVRLKGSVEWDKAVRRISTARGMVFSTNDPREPMSVAAKDVLDRADLVAAFVSATDENAKGEVVRFVVTDPYLRSSRCVLRSVPDTQERLWVVSDAFPPNQTEPSLQPPWIGVALPISARLRAAFPRQISTDAMAIVQLASAPADVGLWAPVADSGARVWVIGPGGKPLPENATVEGVQRSLKGQPEEESLGALARAREPSLDPSQLSVIDTSIGAEAWRHGATGGAAPVVREPTVAKNALLAVGVIAGIAFVVLGGRRAAS